MRFLFLRQVRESFHLVVTKSREQQKTPVDSELREKQTRSGRILERFLGCIVGQFSLEVGTTTPATAWNIGVPSASVSPGFANDLRQGCPAKPCRHRTAPWSCFNPLPHLSNEEGVSPEGHLPSSRSLSRCVKMPQRFGKLVMSFFSFNNCIK